MRLAKSEAEIAERTARFLKAELKRADVTYEELAKRLKEHGFNPDARLDCRQIETGYFCGNFFARLLGGAGNGRDKVRSL